MTVAIVRISPLAVVAGPWGNTPGSIQINGWKIDSAPIGSSDGALRLVDVVYAGDPPTAYHAPNGTALSLSNSTLTITRTWAAPGLIALRIVLKAKLEKDATLKWIDCRGAKAANIETAVTNGRTSIDNAGTVAAAIAAYQGVVWP